MEQLPETKYTIADLLYLMQRLRDPETGCPWDLKQDFSSIAAFTLEEVYEVVDTIERQDYSHLSEELGDLLFQVVFYGQLGDESNLFDFNDITHHIVSKLLARHPHVFPDGTLQSRRTATQSPPEQAIKDTWESLKKRERNLKGQMGILDDVPVTLPALSRAEKIQKRVANHGFDWPNVMPVVEKVHEEIEELRQAIHHSDQAQIEDEFGDVLFTMVNLARHLGINTETALRKATRKFENRFRFVERKLSESEQNINEVALEQLENYWQQAKSKKVT